MNKEQIKTEMIRYLQAQGWPNNIGRQDPDRFIMQHLDSMFEHLLKKGLVKREHYNDYFAAATIKYNFR